MAEARRYQLQKDTANRLIADLLDVENVPAERRWYFQQLLTTVLKLYEDGAGTGDLKITNTALKELRYAYKVFAPYGNVRKVTVFGSARAASSEEAMASARLFGKRMTEEGWMVVTGAGAGIMGAAQEGAGGEKSFGLNIRLPFEQEANPWIASDPKLISFKYFFTRKLFLVREAHAMAFLPGGFGTADEAFEALTLIQTGKSPVLPLVMLDEPGGTYWKTFDEFIRREMVGRGTVSPNDPELYRVTDDVEQAAAEVENFYKLYHSQRYVRDALVLRIRRPISPAALADLNARFTDILSAPATQAKGPIPGEGDELPDLPRLVLPFNRSGFSRLRALLDFVNAS